MKGKVVVVGSANLDLVMKMARLPKVGETVTEAAFVQAFADKGANQAVGPPARAATSPSSPAWATTPTEPRYDPQVERAGEALLARG
jgi:hypothetical protein